jgi:hypothetical protein
VTEDASGGAAPGAVLTSPAPDTGEEWGTVEY